MDLRLVLLFIGVVVSQRFRRPRPLRRLASPAERDEILKKCRERDHFRRPLVSLDTDCSLFAACVRNRRLTVQTCAPGTLFDEFTRICNHADLVNCSRINSTDPCTGLTDGFHEDAVKSKPSQAAVMECSGGRTIGGRQCEVCEQFGGDNGCLFIPDCNIQTTPRPSECFNEADPDDPKIYYTKGVKTRTAKECANGTLYNAEECGCSEHILLRGILRG